MANGTSNDDANANFGLSPVGTGSSTCSTPQPGDLGVLVTDAKYGTPISGADVKTQGPESWQGITDGGGVVIFQGIAGGACTVTGTKSGYTIDTASVNVPQPSSARDFSVFRSRSPDSAPPVVFSLPDCLNRRYVSKLCFTERVVPDIEQIKPFSSCMKCDGCS
jgi:hypothetical protein